MALKYDPDWLDFVGRPTFGGADTRTAERWDIPVSEAAEQLVLGCRDGKIETRYTTMSLDERIAPCLWDHERPDGATAHIRQVLVLRESLETWWRSTEAEKARHPGVSVATLKGFRPELIRAVKEVTARLAAPPGQGTPWLVFAKEVRETAGASDKRWHEKHIERCYRAIFPGNMQGEEG